MKKLLVPLLLLALLGGAGAGYWFFLRESPAEGADAAEGPKGPSTDYIKLEPIVLPVLREGRVTLHITALITFELAQPVELARLGVLTRQLRDRMLSELHGIYALRYVQRRGYDTRLVEGRLHSASEQVLGPGTVKEVLLRAVDKRALEPG